MLCVVCAFSLPLSGDSFCLLTTSSMAIAHHEAAGAGTTRAIDLAAVVAGDKAGAWKSFHFQPCNRTTLSILPSSLKKSTHESWPEHVVHPFSHAWEAPAISRTRQQVTRAKFIATNRWKVSLRMNCATSYFYSRFYALSGPAFPCNHRNNTSLKFHWTNDNTSIPPKRSYGLW